MQHSDKKKEGYQCRPGANHVFSSHLWPAQNQVCKWSPRATEKWKLAGHVQKLDKQIFSIKDSKMCKAGSAWHSDSNLLYHINRKNIFVFISIKKIESNQRALQYLNLNGISSVTPGFGWPAHTTASGRPVATPPLQRLDGDLDFHTLCKFC